MVVPETEGFACVVEGVSEGALAALTNQRVEVALCEERAIGVRRDGGN